ncbi:hypothetical protein CBR_g55163 [Chara braunii]|uniref:Uncharacterized protein n=1 Tax=Chara braunii TaxID=69332 RepID=A0A388MCM6_CHABU|nr:hypothetical protein CBR_g55163 [Chara braunii]|eukprot:GBG92318.1 hypothetical protein CBR_g55163 [Chara braunii]
MYTNVRAYYTQFADQQTQSFIDERVKAYVGQTAAVLQQVGGAFPFTTIPTSSYKPPLLPPPTLPIPGSTSSGTTSSTSTSTTQGTITPPTFRPPTSTTPIPTIRAPVLQPPRQPASSAAPPLLRPPTSSIGTAGLVGPPPNANGPLSISQPQNSTSSNLQGMYRMTLPQLPTPAQPLQQPQSLGSQPSTQQSQQQQTLPQDLAQSHPPSQQRPSTLLPGSLQSSPGNGYAGGPSQSQRVGVGPMAAPQAAAGSTYGGGGGGGIGTPAATSGPYGSYSMSPSIRSSVPGASLSSGGTPSLGPSMVGPLGPPASSQPSTVYSYNAAGVGMGRSMNNPGGAVPTMNGSAESASGQASSRVPGGGVPIGPSPYMGTYGVSVAGGYRTGMS